MGYLLIPLVKGVGGCPVHLGTAIHNGMSYGTSPCPLRKGDDSGSFVRGCPVHFGTAIHNGMSYGTSPCPLGKGDGLSIRLVILFLYRNRKVSHVNFLLLVLAIAETNGLDRSLVAIGTDAVLVLLEVHLLPVLSIG